MYYWKPIHWQNYFKSRSKLGREENIFTWEHTATSTGHIAIKQGVTTSLSTIHLQDWHLKISKKILKNEDVPQSSNQCLRAAKRKGGSISTSIHRTWDTFVCNQSMFIRVYYCHIDQHNSLDKQTESIKLANICAI